MENKLSRNILLTGGAGFIGSHVLQLLTSKYTEYTCICYDKLDYCSSLKNIENLVVKNNFIFEQGDITDPIRTQYIFKKYKIDTVLHFAAQSHVDLSFGNSYSFTKNNVLGTHVLLECSVSCNIKLFLHVSTDEVYGEVNHNSPDLTESAILCPTNPYSASKAAAEMLVNAYYKSFKLPIIIVRSNNVYGPNQFPEKVIPKFITMLMRDIKLTLHGNGSPTRRYVYATDVANAFDIILHKGKIGEIYNIDSPDEIANIDLCSLLILKMKLDKNVFDCIEFTQDRPFNDMRYAVDGKKLAELGWSHSVSFSDGISKTIDWYKNNVDNWWGDISTVLTAFPHKNVQ